MADNNQEQNKNLKVVQLEEKVTELVTAASQIEDRIRGMEAGLYQAAEKSELGEVRQKILELQELCQKLKNKVATMEGGNADLEKMKKALSQIATKLGMHDVRLAEQDHRFQVIETPNDGTMIMKIEDYTRKKHEAVVGKTLSLYSQPFYTSKYGYKMCARVYLNGDGIGEGTDMSVFIVIMRGEYDDFPGMTWPFSHEVTFTLLAHDAQSHLHISKTMRPDPTRTSFQKPTGAMNVAAGFPLFVSQTDVEIPTYIKDDTLFIKVSVAC